MPEPDTRLAVAASAAVADLISGPRRRIEVAVATPHAVYLATGDPDRPALCLAGPAAVRVPCAVLLAAPPPAGLSGGGWVGGGEFSIGAFHTRVTRWWRPPRPRSVALTSGVPTPLDRDLEAALAGLVDALASGSPLASHVLRLLGRGPGLTPLGDDVLAGLLVTLVALGAPASDRLAATVSAYAPARTTFVSAALLHHAARGECVPELAAVLDGGGVDALLRVGHTSGAGLLRGVHGALAATAPTLAAA
jgi:hypothetical protein